MSSRWRSWIVPVIFWALFVASIGLGKRYRWLDTAWCVAGMLFLLGISVYSVIYTVRHRHETGSISYKGIPRWLDGFPWMRTTTLPPQADAEVLGLKAGASRFKVLGSFQTYAGASVSAPNPGRNPALPQPESGNFSATKPRKKR